MTIPSYSSCTPFSPSSSSSSSLQEDKERKRSLCCLTYRKIASLLPHHIVIDKTSEVSYHWKSSIYDDFVEKSFHSGIVIYLNLDRLSPRLRSYLINILPRQSEFIQDTTSMMFVDGSAMGFARRAKTPSLKCQGAPECTNEAMKVCSLCKKVRYCSRKCQETDWKERHYITCNNGWIETLASSSDPITICDEHKGTGVVHQDRDLPHNVVSELRQFQLG